MTKQDFQHAVWHPRPYSNGVAIGSDWKDKADNDPLFGLYKKCGFWSDGEARLLHDVACQFQGDWLEIGAHTGWCSSIIADSGSRVVAVEPMFAHREWTKRFEANMGERITDGRVQPWDGRSDQYFASGARRSFDGGLIDGDHDAPRPMEDARGIFARLNERAVVLLHDFRGPPVWDAARWLVEQGMRFRVYPSVHMVCVCWRGDFKPPIQIQEGAINWAAHYGMPEWAR